MRKICHTITFQIEVPIGVQFKDGSEATAIDLKSKSNAKFFVDVNGSKRIKAGTADELVEKLKKQIEEMFW